MLIDLDFKGNRQRYEYYITELSTTPFMARSFMAVDLLCKAKYTDQFIMKKLLILNEIK